MKTAIMDIGSNSVRLMWGKCGDLNRKQIITTQLAEGLDKTGTLSNDAETRTIDAIRVLADSAKASGARNVVAFATEAVRRAENGAEFCTRVERETNVPVEVIDGDTEAACGFSGAKAGEAGRVGVLDIGGASVELSVGETGIEYAKSLPIGVVRMKERYNGDYAAFVRDLPELTKPFSAFPGVERLIGIGGTPTSFAAIRDGAEVYDPQAVHGRTFFAAELQAVAERVSAMTTEQFTRAYPMFVRRRAEVMPYGLHLLSGVLTALLLDKFTVSERDNLEGYALIRGIE